jgi:hypothetical protein
MCVIGPFQSSRQAQYWETIKFRCQFGFWTRPYHTMLLLLEPILPLHGPLDISIELPRALKIPIQFFVQDQRSQYLDRHHIGRQDPVVEFLLSH